MGAMGRGWGRDDAERFGDWGWDYKSVGLRIDCILGRGLILLVCAAHGEIISLFVTLGLWVSGPWPSTAIAFRCSH